MLPQLYHALTTYEGMYICYVIPIVYFSGILFTTISNNVKLQKRAGVKGMLAVVAMLAIAADFANYSYLFFNKTGKLLPPNLFYLKYGIGFFSWLWVLHYCYRAYFSRQAAGKYFRQRLLLFALVIVGGIILAGLGIAFLPAHPTLVA